METYYILVKELEIMIVNNKPINKRYIYHVHRFKNISHSDFLDLMYLGFKNDNYVCINADQYIDCIEDNNHIKVLASEYEEMNLFMEVI